MPLPTIKTPVMRCIGLTENAGRENNGPSKSRRVKMQDMKIDRPHCRTRKQKPVVLVHKECQRDRSGNR